MDNKPTLELIEAIDLRNYAEQQRVATDFMWKWYQMIKNSPKPPKPKPLSEEEFKEIKNKLENEKDGNKLVEYISELVDQGILVPEYTGSIGNDCHEWNISYNYSIEEQDDPKGE